MPRKSVSKKYLHDIRFLVQLNIIGGKRGVLDFCMKEGLIANKYECPTCGEDMQLVEKKDGVDGFKWQCERAVNKKKHTVNRSVRKGSWFDASKLGMDDILIITRAWVEAYENHQISRLTRVDANIVADWMSFCQEVCLFACVGESTNLGGDGEIVEIESLLGKRNYNKDNGKPMDDEWVFGGVQNDNKYFFEVVPHKGKDILLEIIQRRIFPGTVVISDCWETYKCLKDERFKSFSVNQKVTFKNPVTGASANNVEGLWSSIRRKLHKKKQVEKIFDSNLAEFMWRRRHKNDPDLLFKSFLKAIVNLYPPMIKDEKQNENKVDSDVDEPQPGPSWKRTKYEKKGML